MFTMEGIEEQDFLSLRLSIATDSDSERTINNRKRKESESSRDTSESSESYEEGGKIFTLLQMRDQMLKIDDHHKRMFPSHGEDEKGLELIRLLLISATSVNEKNSFTAAAETLFELYRNVCLTGDSIQRVAAYFADGLLARLLTQKSPFYEAITKPPTPEEKFLSFTELYKVSPIYQFAHFSANQAILEAFETEQPHTNNNRTLHVIDFDVSYGFQWPSLMQSLSENTSTDNLVSLKITGYGRNSKELRETESRLVSFAKLFGNVVFEFHGLLRGSKLIKPKKQKNETLAVNLVLHLNSFNTLKYVRSLNPSIVVLVEREGSMIHHHNNNFLSRFMESLHYYAAMFDSLDDCLPLDSGERLSIEKYNLGKEIIKSVVNNDNENCVRFETWKERMEGHAFLGVEQSLKSLMQAKLLLKIRSHCCSNGFNLDGEIGGGFRVYERDDGRAMSLGWQERFLITVSSWNCV